MAGGGPAGMMLGFLLARAGIEVAVLEKHADFFRDFRGDTIHPSTLELMYELRLLEKFLALPHDEVTELSGFVNDEPFKLVDLTHLPTHCKFVAFMPQWNFLNFLAEEAKKYPTFHLRMQTEAHDLIREAERVVGVRATDPQGDLEIRAALTVGADGRSSTLREVAKMRTIDFGAPMDVLWLRIPREPNDPGQAFGFIKPGKIFVLIGRQSYWQCAYVIPKGSFAAIQAHGLEAFRANVGLMAPFVRDRLDSIKSWDDVKLLTVQVDRLAEWYSDGLLFIGDAAHAMSPIGGVGINLAIQDGVAAANLLYPALNSGNAPDLAAVQRRRTYPTVATQTLQLGIQKLIIGNVLRDIPNRTIRAPLAVKAMSRFPVLRRIPAYLIGVGFRPEHVRTPERAAQ
ncbi:MAG TPA: FAD-dependent oxidoreductase [Candidatus Rubrimentiphilum sp.]|nr:FAD-dependent oxidoreductase [Candidatus Rubrimentiphilum sp.]